jgi:Ulp1 family protease
VLEKHGPESLSNFAQARGLDVFAKKMLFIPVCIGSHWSLFVAVNAGSVTAAKSASKETQVPAMIIMDSLRVHDYESISSHIRSWLDNKWNVICGSVDSPAIMFDDKTCPSVVPPSKFSKRHLYFYH